MQAADIACEALPRSAERPSRALVRAVDRALVDVAAGWVAAKVGNESPMINAFAVGLVGCVLTLLMPQSENLFPAWYNIIAFVTIIPLMLAGAHIATADD